MADAEGVEEANGNTLAEVAMAAMRDKLGEENGYLTGLVGIVAFIDGAGQPCWSVVADPSQQTPMALGLLKILNMAVEATTAVQIFGSPEE